MWHKLRILPHITPCKQINNTKMASIFVCRLSLACNSQATVIFMLFSTVFFMGLQGFFHNRNMGFTPGGLKNNVATLPAMCKALKLPICRPRNVACWCVIPTVDGSEIWRSPVEVGSLSIFFPFCTRFFTSHIV